MRVRIRHAFALSPIYPEGFRLKRSSSRRILAILAVMTPAALFGALAAPDVAAQQPYHNIVNQRWRTVSNGPQSALVVDVKDASDTVAVRRAVQERYSAFLESRRPAFAQELAFLRQHRVLKPGQQLDLSDAVILRQNGRLLLPEPGRATRAPSPGNNNLTFNIPIGTGDGQWNVTDAGNIQTLINFIYPELKRVYGPPLWNGTVTVLNKDPRLGKVDEVIGALLVINSTGGVEIWFPTFSAFETQFLAMTQVMAQAFHGPYRIAYDAWEQGMARAATVVAARDLQGTFPSGGTVNPANGFYFTPFYDLLNQPPLSNNTFTPPTKSNQPFNATTLSGMLVPRLQMSSTAWLKCYIENPNFFINFNAAYYTVLATEPGSNIQNDVSRLRGLASQAVGGTVEMQPFDSWFEHQYVLDTSVTAGPKLYAYVQPTFPSSQGDDNGAAIFLVFYQTSPTGDETDLSGTVTPIFWDYTFQNRLNLSGTGSGQVTITNGFGTIAPFFTGIGGTPPNQDQMRVAMDFPINNEYVRVYFPAGQTGTEAAPNDFSGVTVGADSGNLAVTYEGGGTISLPNGVVQGAFGASGPSGSVPNGFSRTKLVFTPTGSGTPITFQRNTAFNNTFGVAPIFQLVTPAQVQTLSHTFAAGAQMISLPLRPLNPDLAQTLGTNPNATLLAQWREDTQIPPNTLDHYARYPTLPLYQPGYGLWSNFSTDLNATNILGEQTTVDKDVSIGLNYGWNQIGSPYTTDLNVTSDLSFTYQGTLAPSLDEAITNQWVAAGIIAYSSASGYQDITSTSNTSFKLNTLEAWKGYWIRVLVPEGLTLTYSNPNNRSVHRPALAGKASGGKTRAAATSTPERDAWRVPLSLADTSGHTTGALLGQSPRGADAFIPALDVASPPPFTRSAMLSLRFPHTDWDTGTGQTGGDFLADIRHIGARSAWTLNVSVPEPDQTYTLAWSNTATLPRGTRLTLVDTATGTRQLMNSGSSYAFHVGKEMTRSFQVVAEPNTPSRLSIRNVVALLPPPGLGGRAATHITISYELTGPAETLVEIRSGTGRLVRHLAAGRAATTGINQMVWDMKDDQGRGLPAGPYMLHITARAPEGDIAHSVVPVLITR